jgi:hypothetical protein
MLPNPTLTGVGGFTHALLADSEGPAHLNILVSDPDPTDSHTVSITAFRGDEDIAIESSLAVDQSLDYALDPTVIPEGPGWRFRIVATDSGLASSTFESGSIHISHHTTTDTFEDISPLLDASCGVCHSRPDRGGRVPYLNFTLSGTVPIDTDTDEKRIAYEEFHRKVTYNKGNMFKRLAEEQNMPPASANGVLLDESVILTDENRARIADYLLGGAPR